MMFLQSVITYQSPNALNADWQVFGKKNIILVNDTS